MFFIILFPFLSLADSISLKGNWKDSSLKDEALVFFEKVEPSLFKKVKSSLELVDEDDQSQILNALSKFVYQPLFGLLNLSLSLRFYQPAASIKSPKEGNPKLHGWYLLEKQDNPDNFKKYLNVHFSLINSLNRYKSSIEKFNFLKTSSFSIKSLINPFKSQLTVSAKQLVNKYPQDYYYSGINGRIIKPYYFDILDGLIEEYRSSKLFSFSKSLLHKRGYRQPHYFTQQLTNTQHLPPFNIEKVRDKWSDEPKVKSDNLEFLRCKKPIATVNIYFDLNSPESPALLNWAIEHVLKTDPIYFNFTFIFDMNNETEKHIGYAWHQSIDTLGVRNSVLFMIDGFKKKNFKRAYKATIPTLGWKKIKNNMVSGNRQTVRINNQLQYCKEKNITVGAAINGEFIQERPIFPIIEDKLFSYVARLKNSIGNGVKIDFSKIIDWTRQNSIELESSTYPVEITFNNYITINGFSNNVINDTAYKIISLSKIGVSSYKYPVLTFNAKKSHESKFNVDISEFTDEEIKLLKINKNDTFTIIGPLVFQGAFLTETQLKFAQDYIDYVFITKNLESDLSKENLLLALFYRSSNALDGIERNEIKSDLPNILKVDLITNSTLTWEIVDDPLSYRGPLILDMASHVYESGAASVIYHPNVKHSEYDIVPTQFFYRFSSSFNQDEIDLAENKNYFIKTSPYWSVQEEKVKKEDGKKIELTCTSILSSSLLNSKGKRIQIGKSLFLTSTNDIGYFSPALPAGKYTMKGMSSSSIIEKSDDQEDYYNVDSFVPHIHFYFRNSEKIDHVQSLSNLNVVLRPENCSSIATNDIKILMYSIINNAKKDTPINFFILSDFPFEKVSKVNITVLPMYIPHFYKTRLPINKQLAYCWKFIFSDIYLSNNEKYLFLDSKMLFTGDATRFLRLDMSNNAVVAAPIMTDQWFIDKSLPWNSRKLLMMRFKRPYHTTSLVWIDMNKWSLMHIGDRFRMLLMMAINANNRDDKIGEILFNSIQLYAQFITLPEEIAFNSNRSPHKLALKALSLDLTASEGVRLAKVKYEKVKAQALNYFE